MNAAVEPAVFLWAAIGSADSPPDRVKVESCTTCAALVPVEKLDVHGLHHRALIRAGVER